MATAVIGATGRVGSEIIRGLAATITEVEGSHVIMISQPDAVTDVILDALATVTAPVAVG
jgi:uncharacterized protein YbjT (DUF2867 family)